MDIRRRNTRGVATVRETMKSHKYHAQKPKNFDLISRFIYLINGLFFTIFFSVMYYLLHRWREKIRNRTPLHVVTLSEMIAIASLIGSGVYLLGFFGIDFVKSVVSWPNHEPWVVEEDNKVDHDRLLIEEDSRDGSIATTIGCVVPVPAPPVQGIPVVPPPPQQPVITLPHVELSAPLLAFAVASADDEELISQVLCGKVPSYSLESKLGDCKRAAAIRRQAVQRMVGRSVEGLPLEGFDYESILGQCCEMPVGYVQIPVGIAGPLLLDGREYSVPMATTEGCLVASTNRGCKAIFISGGATSTLLRDGMTRAPVVRFPTAKRAADLKFFMEDPVNFETISVVFNKSSRFGRLQGIKCAIAGKNLYIRFNCSTGDAMGMNMVSKGVQNVLDYLQNDFPDMDVMGISGNLLTLRSLVQNIQS